MVKSYIIKHLSSLKTFPKWDSFIKANWSSLKVLPSQGSFSNNTDKILAHQKARWLPPPHNCFKLNYDGASRGNPGNSSAGTIIIDENSKILKTVCKILPVGSNNYAEMEALSMGLEVAITLGIKEIIIEGDSMVTYQALINKKINK